MVKGGAGTNRHKQLWTSLCSRASCNVCTYPPPPSEKLLIVECITSGLHLPVFLIRSHPPPKSSGCLHWRYIFSWVTPAVMSFNFGLGLGHRNPSPRMYMAMRHDPSLLHARACEQAPSLLTQGTEGMKHFQPCVIAR